MKLFKQCLLSSFLRIINYHAKIIEKDVTKILKTAYEQGSQSQGVREILVIYTILANVLKYML